MNVFRATPENPFHVSVGAVILDGLDQYIMLQSGCSYSFMCGTIDPGEAPLETLHREAYEEMGARLSVRRFMGSSLEPVVWEAEPHFTFQKCILWFECSLLSLDIAKITDPSGTVVLVTPQELPTLIKDRGRWPYGLLA